MSRVRIACDACDAAAWVGGGTDFWCEHCQQSAAGGAVSACPTCGGAVTSATPAFVELYGMLQHLGAVLAAWAGDNAPLERILPERPRFISDLTPPVPAASDPPAHGDVLVALRSGRYAEARRLAASAGDHPRMLRSLAIAAERTGDSATAETAWGRLLAVEDDATARLSRGALAARRGDFHTAGRDFARAGDTYEAKWNRAALHVSKAVATTPGLPPDGTIARARDAAPATEGEWHEPTVGRLLWTLLVERSQARDLEGRSPCPDERVLRAAERLMEFDSFWDRALVLHGYAATGMTADAGRVAAEVANDLVADVMAMRAVQGKAGAFLRDALGRVSRGVHASQPAAAREALAPLMVRDDLRHYRFPCVACGRGSVGLETFDEAASPDHS